MTRNDAAGNGRRESGRNRGDDRPGRSTWRPSMPRPEAERWITGSAERRPLFHATSRQAAEAIRQAGFDLSRRQLGRTWGNGVYASPDIEVARIYAELYQDDAAILALRANLKRVLQVRLQGSDRSALLRQVLLAVPDGYVRFVDLTVRIGRSLPPAFVAPEAMTRVLVESGI